MASSYASTTVTGFIGRDPEVRQVGDTSVRRFPSARIVSAKTQNTARGGVSACGDGLLKCVRSDFGKAVTCK